MLGRSPKTVNAGPRPDAGPKPDEGPEPDAGPKPDVVNAYSIRKCKRCKSKDAWGHAERCASDHAVTLSVSKKLVSVSLTWEGGSLSVHNSPCHGGRVKTAGGLPAKVGTTRRSCGVGGRDGRPLVIACLAMER
ncbi:hypothetical protein CRG98_032596 [Punica granatum]|uniref:Uncharacterized protein n=1 Tax=Punica granatum TaxID=22663 RepID=A0A2I0ISM9_PUNGR|nr:hypothetical protein CRG98_032596 [Punica granatum]